MARRRTKSADDIRKQTDLIYKTALDRFSSGKMDKASLNARLDRARDAEKKYISNIQSQSLYKKQNADSWRRANATKYQRSTYMGVNNG